LMFHLLSGHYVHDGRTLNEQLMHAMTKPAPRLASAAAFVAPPIRRIVDRALAFAKNARWPDARSMQEAVQQAYEELYGSSITTDRIVIGDDDLGSTPRKLAPAMSNADFSTHPPVERSRSVTMLLRRPWPAAVVGAALVTVAAFLLLSGPKHTPAIAPARAEPLVAAPLPMAVDPQSPETRPTAGPPEVAATDLPLAARPPSSDSPAAKAPPASSAGSAGKVDCHPPYNVDAATGKKHWKLECL
jgi:hypothetical protein